MLQIAADRAARALHSLMAREDAEAAVALHAGNSEVFLTVAGRPAAPEAGGQRGGSPVRERHRPQPTKADYRPLNGWQQRLAGRIWRDADWRCHRGLAL
ncbi:MAG: hypothetical protein ACLQDY_05965 [Streptosporangiaceae bacterium]